MDDLTWSRLAERQAGMLARWQFRGYGVSRGLARHQVRAGRWCERSANVVSATTGPLTWEQRLWLGVLHAGPTAQAGGLTAARVHGLRHWDRDQVTVLVDDELSFDAVPGIRFFRTRRPLAEMRAPGRLLPVCRLEPAVLLFAGYEGNRRTAHGAVAAVVQQRLSTPARLRTWLEAMRPLRRAKELRSLLADLEGGAQSVAEIDIRRACRACRVVPPNRQRSRVDRDGRRRWTDREWSLPDGRVLVLEVDGGFYLEVRQNAEDMRRQCKLTTSDRVVIRCAAVELRHDPAGVMADLIALGVGRVA